MQIIEDEIKKTLGAFKAMELPEERIVEHAKKLENILLMDMAAEAFAEKGQALEDASFTQDTVEDFLLDNYDEEEIADIAERVGKDVVMEYFMKLLIKETDEKKLAVNEILKEQF